MKKGIVATLLAGFGLAAVMYSVPGQASPYEYGEYKYKKVYKYKKYDDDWYAYRRHRKPVKVSKKTKTRSTRCWDDDCYKYSRRYWDHERREHLYKYRYRHYEDD